MVSIALTDEQYIQLRKEYRAKPGVRHILNSTEAIAIAERLNETISLPFLSEEKEHSVIVKIVIAVDGFLYDNLPREIYELIYCLNEGLDDSEAAQLTARISKNAHKKLSFPFLNEHLEYYTITFLISLIINAMREGSDIDHSIRVTKQPRMMRDNFPFPDLP